MMWQIQLGGRTPLYAVYAHCFTRTRSIVQLPATIHVGLLFGLPIVLSDSGFPARILSPSCRLL